MIRILGRVLDKVLQIDTRSRAKEPTYAEFPIKIELLAAPVFTGVGSSVIMLY